MSGLRESQNKTGKAVRAPSSVKTPETEPVLQSVRGGSWTCSPPCFQTSQVTRTGDMALTSGSSCWNQAAHVAMRPGPDSVLQHPHSQVPCDHLSPQ